MNAVNFWLRTTIDWKLKLVLMHESLNCLMILEIFSNLCTSSCYLASWWLITRKVERSKSTTSSAFRVLQNWPRSFSRVFTLGNKK